MRIPLAEQERRGKELRESQRQHSENVTACSPVGKFHVLRELVRELRCITHDQIVHIPSILCSQIRGDYHTNWASQQPLPPHTEPQRRKHNQNKKRMRRVCVMRVP